MIDHVNAVVLPVRDVEKCAAFYAEKLGFGLNFKDAESAFLSIDGKKGGLVLGLIAMTTVTDLISETQVRPSEDSIHRTFYAVFVEDVDAEYRELEAKGVHFVKPPTTHPWGQRIAYFEDPEGNLWEISTFLKT